MAQMQVSKITRKALSPAVRVLEVHQEDNVRTLSTQILKVELPEKFVKGSGKTAPVEQYAFVVDNKTVARFADAAALVLKKHHVAVRSEDLEDVQIYVRKAVEILNGKAELRLAEPDFEGASPAKPRITSADPGKPDRDSAED